MTNIGITLTFEYNGDLNSELVGIQIMGDTPVFKWFVSRSSNNGLRVPKLKVI